MDSQAVAQRITNFDKDFLNPYGNFAHSVLDDYNLSHDRIAYCMEDMKEWLLDNISKLDSSHTPWELRKLLKWATDMFDLLDELLEVDENILSEASEILWGK